MSTCDIPSATFQTNALAKNGASATAGGAGAVIGGRPPLWVIGAGAPPLWRISCRNRETRTPRHAAPVDGDPVGPYNVDDSREGPPS